MMEQMLDGVYAMRKGQPPTAFIAYELEAIVVCKVIEMGGNYIMNENGSLSVPYKDATFVATMEQAQRYMQQSMYNYVYRYGYNYSQYASLPPTTQAYNPSQPAYQPQQQPQPAVQQYQKYQQWESRVDSQEPQKQQKPLNEAIASYLSPEQQEKKETFSDLTDGLETMPEDFDSQNLVAQEPIKEETQRKSEEQSESAAPQTDYDNPIVKKMMESMRVGVEEPSSSETEPGPAQETNAEPAYTQQEAKQEEYIPTVEEAMQETTPKIGQEIINEEIPLATDNRTGEMFWQEHMNREDFTYGVTAGKLFLEDGTTKVPFRVVATPLDQQEVLYWSSVGETEQQTIEIGGNDYVVPGFNGMLTCRSRWTTDGFEMHPESAYYMRHKEKPEKHASGGHIVFILENEVNVRVIPKSYNTSVQEADYIYYVEYADGRRIYGDAKKEEPVFEWRGKMFRIVARWEGPDNLTMEATVMEI